MTSPIIVLGPQPAEVVAAHQTIQASEGGGDPLQAAREALQKVPGICIRNGRLFHYDGEVGYDVPLSRRELRYLLDSRMTFVKTIPAPQWLASAIWEQPGKGFRDPESLDFGWA